MYRIKRFSASNDVNEKKKRSNTLSNLAGVGAVGLGTGAGYLGLKSIEDRGKSKKLNFEIQELTNAANKQKERAVRALDNAQKLIREAKDSKQKIKVANSNINRIKAIPEHLRDKHLKDDLYDNMDDLNGAKRRMSRSINDAKNLRSAAHEHTAKYRANSQAAKEVSDKASNLMNKSKRNKKIAIGLTVGAAAAGIGAGLLRNRRKD